MLTINAQRLLAELRELGTIGATPDGGVSRPSLSDVDLQARAWFKERVQAAGLDYAEDGAGNQSAILPGHQSDKHILAGSHLDSVPNGGQYDGPLGTLAALEALRRVQEAGQTPPMTLEAINFTDEEGSLVGLLGSRAVAGLLTRDDFDAPRGGKAALDAGLQRAKLTPEGVLSAQRDNIAAYIELHVEQAKQLEQSQTQIGVVNAIVGIRSARLRFMGRAAHAGTTPMAERSDALWGASRFISRARQLVLDYFPPGVVNFGIIEALPGAFNIVPAEVFLGMEFRHGSEEDLQKMQTNLLALAYQAATEYNLSLEIEHSPRIEATRMDGRVVQAVEAAAADLQLSHTQMMSFAGHDAMSMGRIAPAAMLFVPSVDGISHNPAEFTRDEDCVNGANVVLQALLRLAQQFA